jgi:hypothetical protein
MACKSQKTLGVDPVKSLQGRAISGVFTTFDCAYSTTIVTGGEAFSVIAPDVPLIVIV